MRCRTIFIFLCGHDELGCPYHGGYQRNIDNTSLFCSCTAILPQASWRYLNFDNDPTTNNRSGSWSEFIIIFFLSDKRRRLFLFFFNYCGNKLRIFYASRQGYTTQKRNKNGIGFTHTHNKGRRRSIVEQTKTRRPYLNKKKIKIYRIKMYNQTEYVNG